MTHQLTITPHGHLLVREAPDDGGPAVPKSLLAAYATSPAAGMVHSASLEHALPLSFAFVRGLVRLYFAELAKAVAEAPLVATPHLRHASYWNEDAAGLEAAFLTLREVIEDEELPLRLHLGGEIAMCDASVEELLAKTKPQT